MYRVEFRTSFSELLSRPALAVLGGPHRSVTNCTLFFILLCITLSFLILLLLTSLSFRVRPHIDNTHIDNTLQDNNIRHVDTYIYFCLNIRHECRFSLSCSSCETQGRLSEASKRCRVCHMCHGTSRIFFLFPAGLYF